jgi:uncharacterized protein
MRVLVLCDDYWHPARIVREGLCALKNERFSFDYIEDARGWSPEQMSGYPLVILTKSNNISSTDQAGWMTEAAQDAFVEYVSRGSGLVAVHSGTAGYDQMPRLRGLLGGVFTHHPPQCPVTVEPVPDHPLAAGISPFTLTDEHYFMALDDAQADVFLQSRSEHGVQPGGWTRAQGQGRLCVLTPGHNLAVWNHPGFQTLLSNALRWCAKEI